MAGNSSVQKIKKNVISLIEARIGLEWDASEFIPMVEWMGLVIVSKIKSLGGEKEKK